MNKTEFDKARKDIAIICDYLAEERKYYEESDRPQNHIWRHVKKVKHWLKKSQSE